MVKKAPDPGSGSATLSCSLISDMCSSSLVIWDFFRTLCTFLGPCALFSRTLCTVFSDFVHFHLLGSCVYFFSARVHFFSARVHFFSGHVCTFSRVMCAPFLGSCVHVFSGYVCTFSCVQLHFFLGGKVHFFTKCAFHLFPARLHFFLGLWARILGPFAVFLALLYFSCAVSDPDYLKALVGSRIISGSRAGFDIFFRQLSNNVDKMVNFSPILPNC
jgi:hypothetical protein